MKLTTTVLLAACAASAAPRLTAQSDWTANRLPQNRFGHAMAVHPVSGDLLMHGGRTVEPTFPGSLSQLGEYGEDPWVWRNGRWQEGGVNSQSGPILRRHSGALLADPVRGRVLLIGGFTEDAGFGRTEATDIWVHTFGNWSLVSNLSSAAPLPWKSTYAYDWTRDRVVAFGSCPGFCPRGNETWEWSLTTGWMQVPTASAPSPRDDAAMAFDGARGRMVLFGGTDGTSALRDTWEWDGTQWTQATPATSPPARFGHGMVSEGPNGGILATGGTSAGSGPVVDAWRYDGVTWSPFAATGQPGPSPRTEVATAFDATTQTLYWMGGYANDLSLSDLWSFQPTVGWRQLQGHSRPPGDLITLVTDRARATLVAVTQSSQSTDSFIFEQAGETWIARPTPGPRPTFFDPEISEAFAGNRLLWFGGNDALGVTNETWEWNGSTWRQFQPSVVPQPRRGAAIAPMQNGEFVLFGGFLASGTLSADTWIWNGTTWRQVSTPVAPTPRRDHVMSLDPNRNSIVLFGGSDQAATELADTWEWNGTQWLQMQPATSPPASSIRSMTYDSTRSVHVLCSQEQFLNTAWDWDGTSWARSPITRSPDTELRTIPWAYDPATGTCLAVRFGGERGSWEYGPVQQSAGALWYGTGCGPAGTAPYLIAEAPYLGEPTFVQVGDFSLPFSGPSFFWMGSSSTQWGNIPLPFSLGAIGAPNCQLLAAPEAIFFTGAFATPWSVELCACPQFAGMKLYLQGMVLDVNPAGGFTPLTTQGVEWTFGLR